MNLQIQKSKRFPAMPETFFKLSIFIRLISNPIYKTRLASR